MVSPTFADRFWGSGSAESGGWLLLGAPLDLTASGRPGTARGPSAIRRASHNIESYSPAVGRDLFDVPFADLGDLDLAGRRLEDALVEIERATADLSRRGRPLLMGGEHTLALAVARAVFRCHPDALVLSLDAHLDLADELEGRRLAHGTWAARLGEEVGLSRLAVLGARSGTRPEWERARACAHVAGVLAHSAEVRRLLEDRPIYLSVDIDVVDPAAAPGTGCPEPGGPTSAQLFEFLYSLRGANVVAMDVNEVLPDVDPAGITATLAAKVIREAVLLFSSAGPGGPTC